MSKKKQLQPQIAFLDEPARITIAARSANGCSLICQRLKPILVGVQYFFQSVNDFIDEEGYRSVNVVTKNEKGEVIAKQALDVEKYGVYYNNMLKEKMQFEKIYDVSEIDKLTLQVQNDKEETVSELPIIMPHTASLPQNKLKIEFIQDQKRRRTLKNTITTDDSSIVTFTLEPVLIGNQYYRQKIVLQSQADGEKLALLETTSEEGRVIDSRELNPEDVCQHHCSEVLEEKIDSQGNRRFMIATINDNNEVICIIEVEPFLPDLQGRRFDQVLEEIIDVQGNKKLTILSHQLSGESMVLKQQIKTRDAIKNKKGPQVTYTINQQPVRSQSRSGSLEKKSVRSAKSDSVEKSKSRSKESSVDKKDVKSVSQAAKQVSELKSSNSPLASSKLSNNRSLETKPLIVLSSVPAGLVQEAGEGGLAEKKDSGQSKADPTEKRKPTDLASQKSPLNYSIGNNTNSEHSNEANINHSNAHDSQL